VKAARKQVTVKFDKKTITLIVSILLNIAGGFGVVPPVSGSDCPPSAEVK
jgi:hypothetical protein